MSAAAFKHAWPRARNRVGLDRVHHRDLQMLKRCANLRAADLAKEMGRRMGWPNVCRKFLNHSYPAGKIAGHAVNVRFATKMGIRRIEVGPQKQTLC